MINSAYPKTDCLGSESSRLSEKHSDPLPGNSFYRKNNQLRPDRHPAPTTQTLRDLGYGEY